MFVLFATSPTSRSRQQSCVKLQVLPLSFVEERIEACPFLRSRGHDCASRRAARTRRGRDHTGSGRTRFRNLTCCLRGQHLRNPRRANEMHRARREQAAARAVRGTSVAITGSIPGSIRPQSFAARSRSCSTRTLRVSIPGQRRFGGRRNDWLVRSVWRRTFNSGQGHQSRPESDLFPPERDRAARSRRGAVWRPGASAAIRAPFRNAANSWSLS